MFDDSAAVERGAPLAARMRPRTLDEIVGQEHLVGSEAPLRRAIEADSPPSCILWGPPGSGKTSIARVIARITNARFATLSAVSSGVADLRKVIASAEAGRRDGLARTMLFIDEIHRFNKAQQDAVLHAVEDGTITLIGATTENPSFEVVAPLLSRARVFKLEPLEPGDVKALLLRALNDADRGLGPDPPQIEDEAIEALATYGAGDARVALNALEAAVRDAHAQNGGGDRRDDRDGRAAGAALRQGRRLALRHDLGVHQVGARLRPGRRRLLAGADAGGGRGPDVRRAADRDPGGGRTSAWPIRRRCRWRSRRSRRRT